MVTLVNRAKMTTATTGTGTLTLGTASDGFQSFADAGVTDGQTVRYTIEDGNDWEIGTGTYAASGPTLTRSVDESSNADAPLNLTGSATVFVVASSLDIQQPPSEGAFVDGDKTKLDDIESGADVTDTANVTAAGALMDSEVTNLAAVKSFDPTDYATAAQGSLADTATQPGDNISTLTNDAGYLITVDEIQGTPIDSTASTPSDGDILVYRNAGSDWVLEAKPASASSPALNDVTDVTISSVSDNEVLAYDSMSGDWINQTASEAGLISGVTAGTGLSGGGASGSVTINGVTQTQTTWEAGTSTTESIVSPAKIKAAIDANADGAVKAWVNFNGAGTVSIRDSFNVSSITDNGTGDYTINFDTALADANYATVASCLKAGGTDLRLSGALIISVSTGSVRVRTGNTDTGSAQDRNGVYAAVFR